MDEGQININLTLQMRACILVPAYMTVFLLDNRALKRGNVHQRSVEELTKGNLWRQRHNFNFCIPPAC